MQPSDVPRATAAARSIATELGLRADDAVLLQESNKLAVRLLPCDVLARVAHGGRDLAQFEVELAQRLVESGSPVAALEPRVAPKVYERDGFVVTLWTYYEPLPGVTRSDYAGALERLHAGMRHVEVAAPHFMDRVAEAQGLLANRALTPELADADRDLLGNTMRSLGRTIKDSPAPEQLLHGEPHPGNVLNTNSGVVFVDLETCCRGPVEFDVAHAPDEVAGYYRDVDHELIRTCRLLVLAMVTTWRWDRRDRFPNGRQLGAEWLAQLRTMFDRQD